MISYVIFLFVCCREIQKKEQLAMEIRSLEDRLKKLNEFERKLVEEDNNNVQLQRSLTYGNSKVPELKPEKKQ
jgi:hypothetical protein